MDRCRSLLFQNSDYSKFPKTASGSWMYEDKFTRIKLEENETDNSVKYIHEPWLDDHTGKTVAATTGSHTIPPPPGEPVATTYLHYMDGALVCESPFFLLCLLANS